MAKKQRPCCKVGASKWLEEINSLRDQHYSYPEIYNFTQLKGLDISKETLIRHFTEHYMSDPSRPAFVPDCNICATGLNDEFRTRYLRGESLDDIHNWLVQLGLDVDEHQLRTHIKHRALKSVSEPIAQPPSSPDNGTSLTHSPDAYMVRYTPPSNDSLSVIDEMKRIIFLRMARVQRRVDLEGSAPTRETRQEIKGLEDSLLNYHKIAGGDAFNPEAKHAQLSLVISKQMNVILDGMDPSQHSSLIQLLQNELNMEDYREKPTDPIEISAEPLRGGS